MFSYSCPTLCLEATWPAAVSLTTLPPVPQAWDLGLGDHLGGPEGVRSMGPRQPQANGPGLLVDPDLVVVEEGSGAGVLRIRCGRGGAWRGGPGSGARSCGV